MLFKCTGTSVAFAQTDDGESTVAAVTSGNGPTNSVIAQHLFSLLSLAINTCNAKSHQSSCSELLHATFKRIMWAELAENGRVGAMDWADFPDKCWSGVERGARVTWAGARWTGCGVIDRPLKFITSKDPLLYLFLQAYYIISNFPIIRRLND
jgi:hypothetical protein